jgi:DNA-directed RNA polymerase subunit M/transcription elongation factor TFIIS
MSSKERKIIRKYLRKFFSKEESEKYEDDIYKSCGSILYTSYAYEKIGQLVQYKDDKKMIKKILKDNNIDWNSCIYDQQKKDNNKILDIMMTKPKASKGIYKCRNKECDSDEFFIFQFQTRSGDEGMTTYRQCIKCGKRKKE